MRCSPWLWITFALGVSVPRSPAAEPGSYRPCRMGDWTIRVESRLLDGHPDLAARALALLEEKLAEVDRLLPTDKLGFLQEQPIWISLDSGKGAAFHPSRQWLIANNRLQDMDDCVEICNARHFLDWSDNQPMMVLHELAHALHHRRYSFDYPPLRTAYTRAEASGLYDNIPRWQGKTGRAYAMNNHKEYFAELTEAFYGLNDIYPFRREDLRTHDPDGYTLIKQMWTRPLPP